MKKSKLKTRKSNPAFAGQEFGFSLKATILLLNTEYRKLNTLLIFALCLCASVAKSDVHYVSKKGSDTFPYTTPETAARIIQNAVNATTDGDTVLVNDGTYKTGGAVAPGQTLMNRVMITNSIILKSINGPKKTRIVGRKGVGKHNIRCVYLGTNVFITGFKITGGGTIFVDDIDYENIDGAGIYSKNGAIISNCYIYNNVTFINWGGNGGGIHANNSLITDCTIARNRGYTGGGIGCSASEIRNCKVLNNRAIYSWFDRDEQCRFYEGYGGGIRCSDTIVDNCIIKGNRTPISGGGIDGRDCTVINSTIIRNRTGSISSSGYAPFGGGGICLDGMVSNCFISKNSVRDAVLANGGGLNIGGVIYNSTITKNRCFGGKHYGVGGGGVWGGVKIFNSLICENKTGGIDAEAGGVYIGYINNCTIIKNKVSGKNSFGGGVTSCILTNSIVYFNTARTSPNYGTNSFFAYSCSYPKPKGEGNIDIDPLLVNIKKQNYHLQDNSPCINVGLNLDWMYGAKDLDGNLRLFENVDVGSYEKQGELSCYFTAQFTNGPVPVQSVFAAYVAGTNISGLYYKWDFDNDGIFEIEGPDKKEVTYNYSSTGIYSVLLSVKNLENNTATYLKEYCVHVYPSVKADFSTSPLSGIGPLTVQFTDLSTNHPHFWSYDFNNNRIIDSKEQNPIFTYNYTGTYSVILMVSNNFGNNNASFDVITKTNYIEIPNAEPIPDFYVDKSFVMVGGKIQFIDKSLYADSWQWDFDNDGINDSTKQNPVTNYNSLGYKNVKLTVINSFATNSIIKEAFVGVRGLTPIHYVSQTGNSIYPYTNWFAATTRIQDAVDAASECDTVLVNNGNYSYTNQIIVTNNIIVKSVNGMKNTIVDGNFLHRCFYMDGKSTLDGFTITNGYAYDSWWGGGVDCRNGAIIKNSTIIACYAALGGGISCFDGAEVKNCIIIDSSSHQGGGIYSYNGIVLNSLIHKNFAESNGAGISAIAHSLIQNCLIIDNLQSTTGQGDVYGGGGIYCEHSTIQNCNVLRNSSTHRADGVSLSSGTIQNSIVWNNNQNDISIHNSEYNSRICINEYNCIENWYDGGEGNINSNPKFISENDFHLQSSSPCVNAGNNSYVNTDFDLDGNPRIFNGAVDMGAYEYNTNYPITAPLSLTKNHLKNKKIIEKAQHDSKKRKVVTQLTKTVWKFKDKKHKDILIGKNILPSFGQYFRDGWLIGLADGTTTDNFNGPYKLFAKSTDKKWGLSKTPRMPGQPTNFVEIKYFEKNNKLIYILKTNMPKSKLIYLLPENYDKTNLNFIKNKLLIPVDLRN